MLKQVPGQFLVRSVNWFGIEIYTKIWSVYPVLSHLGHMPCTMSLESKGQYTILGTGAHTLATIKDLPLCVYEEISLFENLQ